MGINVGWYSDNGYSTGSAPSDVFVPANFSQFSGSATGNAVDKSFFCAGIEGYTTGVVEWIVKWVPTYKDLAPKTLQLWGVGSPLEIQCGSASDGLSHPPGVLTIYAVVNGVTLPNKLRLSIAAGGGDYGAFSWEASKGSVEPMTPYGSGLPSLRPPSELPPCRWVGHAIEMGSAYANVPLETGHDRRRRVYTSMPRVVSASWDFNLEQSLIFYNWYEETLKSGLNEFSIQVANQGPGLLWWRARFVEPYVAEANESGQAFWVSAKVLLVGEGVSDTPYTPEMESSVVVALFGSTRLTTTITISSDVAVELVPVTLLYAGVRVALQGTVAELREDGDLVLREDGDRVLRES